MREGWKKYNLGEVAELKNGKSRPEKVGTYPVYGGNGILGYTDKFNVDNETIIIGRVGAYCGAVYFERNKSWISDNALYAKTHKGFDSKYLFYLLKYKNLNQYAGGSSHPLLTQGRLNELKVEVPPLHTQTRITSILSALDDKIELNRQTNQTLEAIAQAIYKEWFVNFNFPTSEGKPYRDSGGEMQDSELGLIPKEWRVGKLGDLLSFRNGKSSPERNNINGYPVYGANGVIGFASIYNSTDRTIIIGRVGSYCGAIYYTTQKAFVTENAIIAEAYNQNSSLFSFFLMERLNLNNYKVGSGQPLLNQTILEGIDVLLPYKDIVDKFEGVLLPHFINIQYNEQQSSTILTIRNALLPKLMTGEIEV
ncbi:MAG: restriction endonuclease subunit S [Candidatus Brocadia sinica]|nr:restriction endonuclease subunit S [Candidatus Brocadia sinica]NUO06675.1 restriction endonuclease subunit S [Candidatus Brocadia sinica]